VIEVSHTLCHSEGLADASHSIISVLKILVLTQAGIIFPRLRLPNIAPSPIKALTQRLGTVSARPATNDSVL
jgi:hypothetical protein